MKQENGLSMIIIDYLQLMSGSGGRSSDSRQQEISDISVILKGSRQRAVRTGAGIVSVEPGCRAETGSSPDVV